MKPYAGGWLFWKENPSGVVLSPIQCLAYALAQPAVATVLPGCKTVEQLDAALAYLDAAPDDLDYSAVHTSARWALSSTCMYCNHCLPCPAAIDIGRVTRLADSFAASRSDSARREYADLSAHASDCTQCGECLERCPFGVNIISNMGRAAEVFGL
jgi:predicted aldo/keto reductase-like oxidoreductase